MFSQAKLDAARKEGLAASATRGESREVAGDGRLVRRVPKVAYLNALSHGVEPGDESYWSDMDRLYPEITVPYSGKIRITTIARSKNAKVKNRFGTVTWRKVYA